MQQLREHLNYHLDFVIYDDSIALTIEDDFDVCTFLIDTFSDYILILEDIDYN